MKLKGLVTIAALLILASCSKKSEVKEDVDPGPDPNLKFKISGTVKSLDGTPLKDVVVTFDNRKNRFEDTTNDAGQFEFEESGEGITDLYFGGKPLRFLDMRDLKVDYGSFDRTFDKVLVPWEIEEIDFLTTGFIDSAEKKYSLVSYNFEELKMKASDFKNLEGSIHLPNYETMFTSIQSEEETVAMVSFYSMPDNTVYTSDNHDEISYSDVLNWRKILTISTTTTSPGILKPVKVNLAEAYAEHSDYNHSGTVIIVSEEIDATLGVTSDVDLLEIRLPYGDDYEPQN